MSASFESATLLQQLAGHLAGEVLFDNLSRTIYATDASVYKEEPLGVAYPKSAADIQKIVQFAHDHQLALIPRAGGTSLSGQCVGNGLVVDVSRYLNEVIEFNAEKRTIKVQPGIIRDQLNSWLKPHKLFFPPITSTANRATLGGMVGNNSCGTNSIVYGDTRRYVRSLKAILSDGSEVIFSDLTEEEFSEKLQLQNLEGQIYQQINQLLIVVEDQNEIRAGFPKASIQRRNTGYALDELIKSPPFQKDGPAFNFSKIITGSEGTLAFITEIELALSPLPPKHETVVICEFLSIQACMQSVTAIMAHQPYACEMMDRTILDCTKNNLTYRKTRSFFSSTSAAVLLVEFRSETLAGALSHAEQLINDLQVKKIGSSYSTVKGDTTKKLWALRSAGLGLLANIPGDNKGVACIEDTAVDIEDLADYMADFAQIMTSFEQEAIYYAHAGAGEIHLRPILNLKNKVDQEKFHDISLAVAQLVKKYNGSLSGEHGDGRVRAPFIPLVVGEENYQRFVAIKKCWDPNNVFNPHKIVNPKPMNTDLRFVPDQLTPSLDTILDFSDVGGLLRMAEKCNGSGDCRKLPLSGGTMCPSYQATREEKHTTRARANTLRTYISQESQANPFDHQEIKEVLDLCISCKGCTSECPSNIDMSNLKAEFQFQYYKSHRTPLRARVFANINLFNSIGSRIPTIANFFFRNSITSALLKKALGLAPQRSLPLLPVISVNKWYKKEYQRVSSANKKTVYFFCDEFTNYNDSKIGIKAIQFLDRLGYSVQLVKHEESGRAAISKGLLSKAKKHANNNVKIFASIITNDEPLIGIEPSAILSFRDEYPKLVDESHREAAKQLSKNCWLIEEFLAQEIRDFKLTSDQFTKEPARLVVHGHCHQKALSTMSDAFTLLSLPVNYQVQTLETGCCGMAGSFGYEKEHFDVSQQIGELQLYPAIRAKESDTIIVASGTSCRHQILDGTGELALHPVEVLWEALK